MNHKMLKYFLSLVLSLCLSIIFCSYLAYKNFQILALGYSDSTTMNVYLKTDILDAEKDNLLKLLTKENLVKKVDLISRQQLLQDYIKAFDFDVKSDFEAEEYLDLIPEVIEVSASSGLTVGQRSDAFAKLSELVKTQDGVDTTTYGAQWLNRFSKIFRLVTIYGLISFTVILLVLSFVISLLMRVFIDKERYQIEIQTLLGASVKAITYRYVNQLLILSAVSIAAAFVISHTFFHFFKRFILQTDLNLILGQSLRSFSLTEVVVLLTISFSFLFVQAFNTIQRKVKKVSLSGYE